MFFFIAGIQPKTVNLESPSRMCPSCGTYSARLTRVDHYFSLFFLPLFPVKRGKPFIACNRCGYYSQESTGARGTTPLSNSAVCPHCGRSGEASFHYCPYCGKRLY